MSLDDVVTLKWSVVENKAVVAKTVDVFANQGDITRSEFYTSYQSGVNVRAVFYVNPEDYDMSKTIDPNTSRPKYATQLIHNGATYDIVRDGYKKDGLVEIVCK